MRRYTLGLGMAMVLALSACGGGGDNEAAETGGLSSLAGTYPLGCASNSGIERNGNAMYDFTTTVLTANGNNLDWTHTVKLYEPTDTTCSGTVAATHTATGTVTYKNTAQVTLNGTTESGYLVTSMLNAIGGLSSGTTITLNGITYPGDYFTTGSPAEDMYLLLKGNNLYDSTTTTMDPNEYITRTP